MINSARQSGVRSPIDEASEHARLAVLALDDAITNAPAYSTEAVRFLRADLVIIARRLDNIRKVLTTCTGDQGSP